MHQYGFRAPHSCQDLLVKVQQLVFNSKNVKLQSLAIFIDLKRAFDTVDFDILLNKLDHYGCLQTGLYHT
jgi:retron-type reverse transcriptase